MSLPRLFPRVKNVSSSSFHICLCLFLDFCFCFPFFFHVAVFPVFHLFSFFIFIRFPFLSVVFMFSFLLLCASRFSSFANVGVPPLPSHRIKFPRQRANFQSKKVPPLFVCSFVVFVSSACFRCFLELFFSFPFFVFPFSTFFVLFVVSFCCWFHLVFSFVVPCRGFLVAASPNRISTSKFYFFVFDVLIFVSSCVCSFLLVLFFLCLVLFVSFCV